MTDKIMRKLIDERNARIAASNAKGAKQIVSDTVRSLESTDRTAAPPRLVGRSELAEMLEVVRDVLDQLEDFREAIVATIEGIDNAEKPTLTPELI